MRLPIVAFTLCAVATTVFGQAGSRTGSNPATPARQANPVAIPFCASFDDCSGLTGNSKTQGLPKMEAESLVNSLSLSTQASKPQFATKVDPEVFTHSPQTMTVMAQPTRAAKPVITAKVDPEFVMHPAQSAIGNLPPAVPVLQKLYPGLEMLLIRGADAMAAKTPVK